MSLIKPYWRNPRVNEASVEVVKQSIARYGFLQPLVLDKQNVIIVGHSRYKAAMQLGMTHLPCVIAELTPQQAKEYRIADNKTAEFAQWNLDALIPELREIHELTQMDAYFPEYDLSKLLDDVAEAAASVTNANLQNAQRDQSNQFKDRSDQKDKDYIELVCPHCASIYYVQRGEIMDQPGTAKPGGDVS